MTRVLDDPPACYCCCCCCQLSDGKTHLCPAPVLLQVEEEEEPKRKREPTKRKKYTEAFVDEEGWTVLPPSLLWK